MRLRAPAAALGLVFLTATALMGESKAPERHFRFHYQFSVRNLKPGQQIRVWIPLAHSDANQTVRVLSSQSDFKLNETAEREYGNRMLYGEAKATKTEYKFRVDYDVVRREYVKLRDGKLVPGAETIAASDATLRPFLRPDKLVPITGVPADWAQQQTKGLSSPLDKARALYDFTFRTMRYDKSGSGWGRGDVLWACNAKHGNCSDFHSLFISMARSQQIPVRFEIGFALPVSQHEAEIPGYHCWAEFYTRATTWVPVDISEAWQSPNKKDYFFGAHDENRVQFTVGRDLTLNPPQSGPALNYFVYPYVEVDGKEYANVNDRFSFEDIPTNSRMAATN